MTEHRQPTRREFLRATGGVVLAGALAGPVIEACSRGAAQPAVREAVRLPTYVAFGGPRPDLPGTAAGIEPAYLSYPSELATSVTTPPLSGGVVTALLPTYSALPAPIGQNAAWQEVNRRLGGKFDPTIVNANDYQDELTATIARGDLPDFLLIRASDYVPAQFLQRSCQDLSAFLAGDAVKEYPNLANIPPYAWKSCLFDGSLYGLPIPRGVWGTNMLFVQQTFVDQTGMPPARTADDFTRLMKALSRPDSGRVAIVGSTGQPGFGYEFFQQLFGSPNRWRLDAGGRLTRDIELQECRAAVYYVRQLVAAGVFHPDSATLSTNQAKTLFDQRKAAAVLDSWSAYSGYVTRAAVADPSLKVRAMIPFGHRGGKGTYWFANGASGGSFGLSVLRKNSSARIKELLRMADFMAAPFGTTERLLLSSGVKDVDFTLDPSGAPVPTARGARDLGVPWGYVVNSPGVLYNPQSKDYARAAHEQQESLLPLGVADPTVGLYSPTNADKDVHLRQTISDGFAEIIAGKRPLSAYDDVVRAWRKQGGDQVRKELLQALDRAGKR